jgi:pimeloyl-ACP methyl ester carboxylesterase
MAPSNSNMTSDPNELVTKKSLAIALSAPRAPPSGSTHRAALLGREVTENPYHKSLTDTTSPRLQQRLFRQLRNAYRTAASHAPHPHLPSALDTGDVVTRALGAWLSVASQNRFRDSGGFRRLVDFLVVLSAPAIPLSAPSAGWNFLMLTKRVKKLRYGLNSLQYIDFFLPYDPAETFTNTRSARRLIFFVHGGAWGSGEPWMYRLVAGAFLELGYAVAIVGYRTYPDGTVVDQVADLRDAAAFLARTHPAWCERQVTVMGHSSGAHIALLFLVDRFITSTKLSVTANGSGDFRIDSFVGLSGPYDISHHFDYEANRGVEEMSPLKPANGYTRQSFRTHSPALRLLDSLACQVESNRVIDKLFPLLVLIHGIEDDTVPFTATAEAGRILRSCGALCQEIYITETRHQDMVMQIMLGGKTLDAVIDWIPLLHHEPPAPTPIYKVHTKSKL